MTEALIPQIRDVLKESAGLSVDATKIEVDANLYAAGMTSFTSVEVMLGLEDSFGVTFPDTMLSRSLFESINSMAAAISQLQASN